MLADFVVDWTLVASVGGPPIAELVWTAFIDGVWGASTAGAAALLTTPSGQEIQYAVRLEFPCTHNVAGYEALVLALQKATTLGARCLLVKSDSQVVTFHVEKEYQARYTELAEYLQLVQSLERKIQSFIVIHVPRGCRSH